MKKMTAVKADLMLLLVTFCWGISYILIDTTYAEIGPFTLNAYRFLIGPLVTFILAAKRVIKNTNVETIKYSVLIGICLALTYITVNFGIKNTTLSNSGFLCAMTIVFTPILALIFLKQKQSKKTVFCICLCVIGIALLTLNDDFSLNLANLKGDLLCLSCGFFYAIDLLITEKAVIKDNVDPYTLGTYQLLTVGIINLVCAFIFEEPVIPKTGVVISSVLFLAIFCTALAFIVQPIAQQYTTSSRVGLVFSLEPVFNVIAAYIFLHEVLTLKSYIGGGIMFLAIILMEVNIKPILKKRQ